MDASSPHSPSSQCHHAASPALWASSCDRELTATLHREQYSNFFAFSSSDSAEGGASFEEAWEVTGGRGGGGRAGDTEEATGAGGGAGEALGEEDKLPVAGRADGGLEGGGSLPAPEEEEEEEEGKVVGGRKGLRGEKLSTRPVNRSGGAETEGNIAGHKSEHTKLEIKALREAAAPSVGRSRSCKATQLLRFLFSPRKTKISCCSTWSALR